MERVEPTITVACTPEEAAALLAATSHYLMYAKYTPGLASVIPVIEEFQRKLVEQARREAAACLN